MSFFACLRFMPSNFVGKKRNIFFFSFLKIKKLEFCNNWISTDAWIGYFISFLFDTKRFLLYCYMKRDRERICDSIIWLRDEFVLGSNFVAAISFNAGG